MLKIPDSVEDLVERNPLLSTGMHNDLLNLTKVARFLLPLVEARVKKPVKPSAILMALSRLRRSRKLRNTKASRVAIRSISVQSSLAVFSFAGTPENQTQVARLYRELRKKRAYVTVTESRHEVTVIVEEANVALLQEYVPAKPSHSRRGLGSLGIGLDENRLNSPGVFHYVFQQLYFQGINVVEIASTATELTVYLDTADVQLAFSTLFQAIEGRR